MPNPRRTAENAVLDTHELVVAYTADIERTGSMTTIRTWGARWFLRHVGSIQTWEEMSTSAQRGLGEPARRFVLWLIVTGRARSSVAYLDQERPGLGVVARTIYPEYHERFVATALRLDYSQQTARDAWSTLCRVAAISGVRAEKVDAKMITAAYDTLADVARRYYCVATLLYQLDQIPQLPDRQGRTEKPRFPATWDKVPEPMRSTMQRFVAQTELTRRPATAKSYGLSFRDFGCWIATAYPDVAAIGQIRRVHIEAFKAWLATDRRNYSYPERGQPLKNGSRQRRLTDLATFFDRLIQAEDPEAPIARLIYRGDMPILDEPLPRFIDDAAATKLMQYVRRSDTAPSTRIVIEILARTGLRLGELVALKTDGIVQIGSSFWMHVPVGKMHTDRYVPLQPELKILIDDWIAAHPSDARSQLLLHEHGRPWPKDRINKIVTTAAEAAGIGRVTPHQLRHTLATQAINRGMSLEAIAALLGHKTMRMTMVYARIADRTVADEYFAISEKVEALYTPAHPRPSPASLPADAEGSEMRKLRSEMDRRMLGNGYCARPVGMDCHYESVCEGCSFFVTTIEFKPTLRRQRDDAAAKGQIGRQRLFDGLLARLEDNAS